MEIEKLKNARGRSALGVVEIVNLNCPSFNMQIFFECIFQLLNVYSAQLL